MSQDSWIVPCAGGGAEEAHGQWVQHDPPEADEHDRGQPAGAETEDARRAVLHADLDAALTIDWPGRPQPRSSELDETALLVEPLLVAHHRTADQRRQGLNRFEHSTWVAASADTG
jgi:hypothetical protein